MTIRFKKGTTGKGSVILTDEYKGYQISIATYEHGDKPDIRVFKVPTDAASEYDYEDVTTKFGCFKSGEINGTIENIRSILNEIDKLTI